MCCIVCDAFVPVLSCAWACRCHVCVNQAIVTGPGNVMEVFTPGVVVATVMPNFTVSKSDEQVY